MPSLAVARAANAQFSPSYIPIALFVGGTSGIGQAMVEAFARYTKGNAHIIICGRNRAAAEAILNKLPKPTVQPAPPHEFLQCDVALMKNVGGATNDLLARLPKLNYLVFSAGYLTLKGRDETAEGIDKKLALNYYARFKFAHDLAPLLGKASDAGEDARFMSVFSAGEGGPIDLTDLGLKKTFSLSNAAKSASTYNDCMIEEFASRYPSMTFTHIFPGFVRTPIINSLHWTFRFFGPILYLLFYPLSVSAEQCAEHMLYGLFSSEKGAFRRNNKGDVIPPNAHTSEGVRKAVWEHSVQVTDTHTS